MSDREQAIDDVAKHLRCEIDAVIEACKEDELAMEYAVSQRERVIALERALRPFVDEVPCRFDHHGYCQTHGSLHDGPCDVATARQLLNGKSQ